jgi:release factor glutamine methyltransferase
MWQEESDIWTDVDERAAPRAITRVRDVGSAWDQDAEVNRVYRRREGRVAHAVRKARAWHFRLLRARRCAKVDLARVGGNPLLVVPGVFHPQFFLTTRFFLRLLDSWPIPDGIQALDIGTGSGAIAVALALRGAQVTAVDVNPEAVLCARANALLNGVHNRMTVLEGDLFAPLGNRQFDLITFNPPFYERPARDLPDYAWAGGAGSEAVRRFCREAIWRLRPGGSVLIMGSTEAPYTAGLQSVPGYRARIVASKELLSERLFLFALEPGGVDRLPLDEVDG